MDASRTGICVFCGARTGRDPAFAAAARELGACIARRGRTLLYGGGNIGLMGVLADAALAAGGRVVGVIPRFMVEEEKAHRGIAELVEVRTMHERKAELARRAGAFVALPGGVGTLDEMFEAITWNQLRIHRKPTGFLNVAGFFDPLEEFLKRAHAEGLVLDSTMRLIVLDADPGSLLDRLDAMAQAGAADGGCSAERGAAGCARRGARP